MIGDKLIIKPQHTQCAVDICELLIPRDFERFTISIAGESGAGKSELAFDYQKQNHQNYMSN